MARLRTRMSKIKELLRLKFDCHLPNRSISEQFYLVAA